MRCFLRIWQPIFSPKWVVRKVREEKGSSHCPTSSVAVWARSGNMRGFFMICHLCQRIMFQDYTARGKNETRCPFGAKMLLKVHLLKPSEQLKSKTVFTGANGSALPSFPSAHPSYPNSCFKERSFPSAPAHPAGRPPPHCPVFLDPRGHPTQGLDAIGSWKITSDF